MFGRDPGDKGKYWKYAANRMPSQYPEANIYDVILSKLFGQKE